MNDHFARTRNPPDAVQIWMGWEVGYDAFDVVEQVQGG